VRRVVVLNTGSSSLKWVLFDADTEAVIDRGTTTWRADEFSDDIESALRSIEQVDAVGHRVVHGGARYVHAVLVDDTVRQGIADLCALAPLHNPAALVGIDAARRAFPAVPHVAAFDTAFHATMPPVAALYPLPWEWTHQWGLRRFGFHGLSVQYAVGRVSELLGARPRRLVVCHFGAGCSVTAVANGQSINTSMGFTPLEGMMMTRRSGSIDPGLVVYLLRSGGLSPDQVDKGLNQASGLLGVSGVSTDLREVIAAAQAGNERATLAVSMFVDRAAQAISGMLPCLGGLDALVFTGGIGEHSALARMRVAAAFDYLGMHIDDAANENATGDVELSAPTAQVRIFVIEAREDLTILADVKRLVWPA
jgi:acetate kinase